MPANEARYGLLDTSTAQKSVQESTLETVSNFRRVDLELLTELLPPNQQLLGECHNSFQTSRKHNPRIQEDMSVDERQPLSLRLRFPSI